MTTVAGYPLLQALSKVDDFCKSRGKRHALSPAKHLGAGLYRGLVRWRLPPERQRQPTLRDGISTLSSQPGVVSETLTTTRRTDLHRVASKHGAGANVSSLGLLDYDSLIEGLRRFAWHSADAVKLLIERPRLSAWTRMK